jgi:hypothetical protein
VAIGRGDVAGRARRLGILLLLVATGFSSLAASAMATEKPRPVHDSGKLIELAHFLAPDDPSLAEEVRLAVDRPGDYAGKFAERLHGRRIEGPIEDLPWIALADGLGDRDLLREIDWKEAHADVTWKLDQLTALRPALPDRWTWLDGAEWADKIPEAFLPAIGKHLLQGGLALVTFDIDSDSYLLMVLPTDRVQEGQDLAERAGYGTISQW